MSRVLISDNAALFQMLEPSFVRRRAWEIDRAGTGGELVEAARRHRPDLILLEMEPADIIGSLGALKADPDLRPIPVMVVASADDAVICSEAGADATLTRPVEPESLVSALCTLAGVPYRETLRAPVRIAARLESPAGPIRGRVNNISADGLFLEMSTPMALHAAMDLCFRLPFGTRRSRVRVAGTVVRQVQPDADSHLVAGVGIRFGGGAPGDRQLIERFMNEPIRFLREDA